MALTSTIDQFDLRYLSWRLDTLDSEFTLNIQRHGVLVPLVCVEFNGERYIIDGFKRYRAALHCGLSSLPYVLIDPDIPMVELVFTIQYQALMSSTIHKLGFLQTFEWPLDVEHLSRLSLPFYAHIKKDMSRCWVLPTSSQIFLHQKGFSFKEILNLLHYSSNCFEILLSDDVSFNFSKRTFDEALSMVSALVKRHGISITDVLQKTNYDDLKGAKLTAAQRLTQWMTNLRRLSSPVLIETKRKIDHAISLVSLPANISYDHTLEQPGISIQTTISSVADLDELTLAISNAKVKHQIMDVIDLI